MSNLPDKIINKERDSIRFLKFVHKTEACWIWKGQINAKTKYGYFWYNKKNMTAHRASFQIYNAIEIPDGMCVCHRCDNRACVNPDHLWLGSHKENTQDMIKKGRKKVWNKVFNLNQEQEIFSLYKEGKPQRDIAKQFFCHQTSIFRVIRKFINSTSLIGEGNCNSKFSEKEILEIRKMYIPYKFSMYKIAKKYDVHVTTIQRIIYKETWSHI